MRSVDKIMVVLFLGLAYTVWHIECIRCHTDDGPSRDEVKKIVRACMNKLDNRDKYGNASKDRSNKESYDEMEDDNDDNEDAENNDSNDNSNNNGRYSQQQDQGSNGYDNNRYPNKRPTKFRRDIDRHMQLQQHSDSADKERQHNIDSNRRNISLTRRNVNSSDSSTSTACLTQCFFFEMKMSNRDGFPDKHKVLQVMSKDVRDLELKEFYVDSIQQCFHVLEMEHLREKCQFSRHLVNCLGERARANCDDFQNSMIFK